MSISINNLNSIPIDRTILLQMTGQDQVQDVATAQCKVGEAEFALKTLRSHAAEAKRAVRFYKLRLWSATKGIPGWVGALTVGGASAIVMSVIMIVLAGMSLAPILSTVVMAYVIFGGATAWLLRPLDGEAGGDLVQRRAARLHRAIEDLHLIEADVARGVVAVDRAKQLLRAIQQAAQSEANVRLIETNRLLSIEAGRLYPDEFERYVADIFRHLGFSTEHNGRTGDQGVDVLACKGGVRVAIQAKRYNGSVSNSAIQEVYAGMAHHRCQRCVVVTCSTFTPSAITLAQSTGCVLIDGSKLPALIQGEIAL